MWNLRIIQRPWRLIIILIVKAYWKVALLKTERRKFWPDYLFWLECPLFVFSHQCSQISSMIVADNHIKSQWITGYCTWIVMMPSSCTFFQSYPEWWRFSSVQEVHKQNKNFHGSLFMKLTYEDTAWHGWRQKEKQRIDRHLLYYVADRISSN